MKRTGSRRREFLTSAALAATTCGLPGIGWAAEHYPTKTIRIICTFAAGGSADTVSRIIAQQLSRQMGQSVIVYDIPGAAGNIGTEYVKASRPDGYTILFANAGTVVVNPIIYVHLSFNTLKDFAPVGKIGDLPLLIVGNPRLPAKDLPALIALSKTTRGGLNYGTPGLGSPQQLMFDVINLRTGAKFNDIPYSGGAPAITDCIAGYIPLVGVALADATPLVKAGKLRAFAISGPSRAPNLPDIPTFAECDIRGADIATWQGLMVPANTPRFIVKKLNTQLNLALKNPAVRDRLALVGNFVIPGTPEQFGGEMRSELLSNAQLIKAAHIKLID